VGRSLLGTSAFAIAASLLFEEAAMANDNVRWMGRKVGSQVGSLEDRFPFQRLDAYRSARALAALVHRAAIADAELRDQATRAAKSAFLNLCEGLPDDRPAMRRKYFAQADGSLHETVGAVDLAAAIGALGAERAAEIHTEALRLRALLRGLMRVSGRAR
jgi:four helix bundle protein